MEGLLSTYPTMFDFFNKLNPMFIHSSEVLEIFPIICSDSGGPGWVGHRVAMSVCLYVFPKSCNCQLWPNGQRFNQVDLEKFEILDF